jgi:hypothetical protein
MKPHGQKSDSSGIWAWLMPVLCLLLAIGLVYLAIQNITLKRRLADCAEAVHPMPSAFSDRAGDSTVSFAVYLPDGQELTIRTDSLAAPLLLAWLSYDCEPCLLALDAWNSLAEDYPGQLWGVVRRDDSGADSVWQERYIGFPLVEPLNDSVFDWYGVHATPQTIMVMEDGRMGGVWFGPLDAEAIDRISALMRQPFVERR